MTTTWRAGPALLFCPGDRPDRFEKAAAAADGVILDLEDAVAPEHKDEARAAVVDAVADLDPSRTMVRINDAGTPWGRADLDALAGTALRTVMLPKASTVAQVAAIDHLDVVALCETAAGILAAPQLAGAPGCVGLAWGGQDLAADLASTPLDQAGDLHPTGRFAREWVRFAAAAAGIPAIDTVRTDVADEPGLRAEASAAASAGYHAKLVIHPRQVAPVRAAFTPSAEEVDHARRVVEAAEAAGRAGEGAVLLDGDLLDRPIITRAELVLQRAAAARSAGR